MKSLSKMYESLCNPLWNNQMIMTYCECGMNKACEIRQTAIDKYGGAVPMFKKLVKADSVMLAIGTTRERELEICSKAIKDIGRLTR